MQRGNIALGFLHCYRRAGSILAFPKQHQLDDVVETGVITRSSIDLSVEEQQGCAGDADLLTAFPGLLDVRDDVFAFEILLELIYVQSQRGGLRAEPTFKIVYR